jgi:adenylate cyclase class IV
MAPGHSEGGPVDHESEVEAKFDADHLIPEALFSALKGYNIISYKKVAGWDRYYRRGEYLQRHRCDGTRRTSELTVKSRKSNDSIEDRHEVDLPIREDVPDNRVTAFIKATGWELDLELDKVSYIFHVQGAGHIACIALYDVELLGHSVTRRRFLEVEIDKSSACEHREAAGHLAYWKRQLTYHLSVESPLNESLYEIFSVVKRGPVPSTT